MLNAQKMDFLKTNIKKRIEEIKAESKMLPLVIIEGIDSALLDQKNKLFSVSADASYKDIIAAKQDAIVELLGKLNDLTEDWYWMTYAEYISFDLGAIVDVKFERFVLSNNLYGNFYPVNEGNKQVISTIYDDISEITDIATDENEEVADFYKFYGDVLKVNENYYVTYAVSLVDDLDIKEIELFKDDLPDVNQVNSEISEDAYVIEPNSENDEQVLKLTSEILNEDFQKNINVVISGEIKSIEKLYLERFKILNQLLGSSYSLEIRKKLSVDKPIKYTKEFHDILKRYWGYPGFKELKIYKDIASKSKETKLISQERIISDIVEQAELAIKNDNSYRDVYVTAPTGAGKSVMFQIPALFLAQKYKEQKPLTVVISPLIGLMNDQVDELKDREVKNARTIHSNLSKSEREQIIQDINDNKVDILYLSTETLQNKSDIKTLIGDRKIGLFVVDEAHIVTTWGKTFRADYWYLGIYLQKLRSQYNFPIVTFTATAIYGGYEDMYADTCNSLNMISPISYFGSVKRNDIQVMIDSDKRDEYNENFNDYKLAKNKITLQRLRVFLKKDQKTLVYFSTVRRLNEFYSFLESNAPDVSKLTSKYYGTLDKNEKEISFEDFRSGNTKVMLATKAFGMGINIPDITNVYHFTVTGNLIDYIQEIGRAARNKSKVPMGYAWLDFFNQDFTELKRLYGMSAITKTQILDVMNKIMELYKLKRNRHMVVSAEDFKYLVQNNETEENIDNKIKIILLMIEKDFVRKKGFSPFYARPKQIFGKELVFMNADILSKLKQKGILKYFNKKQNLFNSKFYDAIYEFDMKKAWEEKHATISFPMFKYEVFRKDGLPLYEDLVFCTGINYTETKKVRFLKDDVRSYLTHVDNFFAQYVRTKKYFTVDDLANELNREMNLKNIAKAKGLAQIQIEAMMRYREIEGRRLITEHSYSKVTKYSVENSYHLFSQQLMDVADVIVKKKNTYAMNQDGSVSLYFYRSFSKEKRFNLKVKVEMLMSLCEALGLITYETISSNSPQIYIRVNQIYSMETAVKNPEKYYNNLLIDVKRKQRLGVEMLTYLFTLEKRGKDRKEQAKNYTEDFWNIVEGYFMGDVPEEVVKKMTRKED